MDCPNVHVSIEDHMGWGERTVQKYYVNDNTVEQK
jgi:hypothetical protein